MGSWNRIQFWEDIWRDEQAFLAKLPALYRLLTSHIEPFIHTFSGSNQSSVVECIWDLKFSRNLFDREALDILEQISLLVSSGGKGSRLEDLED